MFHSKALRTHKSDLSLGYPFNLFIFFDSYLLRWPLCKRLWCWRSTRTLCVPEDSPAPPSPSSPCRYNRFLVFLLCLWLSFFCGFFSCLSHVVCGVHILSCTQPFHFFHTNFTMVFLFLPSYLLTFFPSFFLHLCTQESVSIPEDVLKRVLHSLACGKFKVLKRIPQATGGAADSGTCQQLLCFERSWIWLLCLCMLIFFMSSRMAWCPLFPCACEKNACVAHIWDFCTRRNLFTLTSPSIIPFWSPCRQSKRFWRWCWGRREQEGEGTAEQRCARDRHLRFQRSVHVSCAFG